MTPKRILIVEDTKEIARMLQAALLTLDATFLITVVPSAEEAILEITRQQFDLLVIDIRLPGISGLELTRKLRSRNKEVRVVQISGMGDPQLKDQSLKVGADIFFPKPLVMGEFLDAVEKLLGMKKTSPVGTVKGSTNSPTVPAPAQGLGDQLTALRQTLSATATALVDPRGRMFARAGELPDQEMEETLIPAMMASLSSSEKVNRILGQEHSENVLAFRGPAYDLLCAPLGKSLMVLVVLKRSRSSVRLAVAVDELLMAQKDLENTLIGMGVGVPEPVPAEMTLAPEGASGGEAVPAGQSPQATGPAGPEEAAGSVEDLEALLSKSGKAGLKPADVDAFWDRAAEKKDTGELSNPDMLSYDQASRLGLTPDEPAPGDEKKS
ncbi:MAG TPA: response regulator [Anaerolineaceae bacterium]|nr:response regulator [Anaerolineaceae bacterium]